MTLMSDALPNLRRLAELGVSSRTERSSSNFS